MSSGFVTQPGPGYGPATSSTSFTIATGTTTFTTQSGLAYVANQYVIITSQSTGYWVYARVISYSGTNLEVIALLVFGPSSTLTDWTINLAGVIQAAPGAWVNATLQNSWAAGSGAYTPAYRLDTEPNTVRLSGAVTQSSPPSSSVVFTLPGGYAPAEQARCVVTAVNGSTFFVAYATIATSGTVTINLGGTYSGVVGVWLDSVTFRLQ
jgi:hypothetical protein